MSRRSFHRLGMFAAMAVLAGSIGVGGFAGPAFGAGPAARSSAAAAARSGATAAARSSATGPVWRSVAAPDPHHDAALFDVACTSKVACTSVGEAHVGHGRVIVKGNADPALAARSVQGDSPATAAGPATESTKSTFHGYAIAERWNGVRWQLQHLPKLAHTEFVELVSVACPTARRCVAVGDAASSKTFIDRPVAATWNGSTWRWLALPANTTPLTAVSCTSATSCLALGPDNINLVFSGRAHIQPSAITWNGHRWSTIHLAAPPARTVPLLDAVTCRSVTSCVAVGARISEARPAHPGRADPEAKASSKEHVLAERWNGKSWQVQPTPTISFATAIQLVDVTCPTAASCIAAGDVVTTTGHTEPLMVTSGGIRWRFQPVPPTNQQAFLSAVACDSGGCTAVGASRVGKKGFATLAEGSTASGWKIERTPAVPNPKRELLGVACASSGPCFAVGGSSAGALVEQT